MANRKRKKKSRELAQTIIDTYQPENVEDMQAALKEIFGPMFEAMLQGELNHHLGYKSNEKTEKSTDNRRNGYGQKTLKTSMGEVNIQTPRDREGSFDPTVIPKRKKDISDIEKKVLAMYGRGMSQRDISQTIEDIYGFSVSHEMISDITQAVLPELTEWQNRPLKKCYPFLFVDCMYVTIRENYEARQMAVYTILGYDLAGKKEILGLWLSQSESKTQWMKIFDELKTRGVEDVFFMAMDGISGLEDGAKSIFPSITVQRCIVHLVRNSLKYVPSKDYKNFCRDLKKIYGAPSLKAAQASFESFKQTWALYPAAIAVWANNFTHVEQLFDFSSAIRKIMYTTNAIESIHASFRKVTNKGAFPNEQALLKLLYLRISELERKWHNGHIRNWSLVLNQLMMHDFYADRIQKYSMYL